MDREGCAPSFEMPNEVKEMAHAKPYYGNQHVPKPNNHKAMETDHAKVMTQVLQAK